MVAAIFLLELLGAIPIDPDIVGVTGNKKQNYDENVRDVPSVLT